MVTEMCLPFSSIQWDWMSTERSLNSAWNPDFSEHSVSIQWTFRNVSVDQKENFHPVYIIQHLINVRRDLFIWHNMGDWKTFQTELSWLSTCIRICMKVLFLVVLWWCWRENGNNTCSKHYTVYKNVISQCSCVTAYLVIIKIYLFYQEYCFTQLIQVFTFKNEPDLPSVRYKLENYIFGVNISGKII